MIENPETYLNDLETARKFSLTSAQRQTLCTILPQDRCQVHPVREGGKTLLAAIWLAAQLERGQIGVVYAPTNRHSLWSEEILRFTGRRAETIDSLAILAPGISLIDPARLAPTSRRAGNAPAATVRDIPSHEGIALNAAKTLSFGSDGVSYLETFVPANYFNVKVRPVPISHDSIAAYRRVFGYDLVSPTPVLDFLNKPARFPGKLYATLRRIFVNRARNEPTLVVSFRSEVLLALSEILSHLGVNHDRVDGSVPSQLHASSIERFNSGATSVLLLGSRTNIRRSFPSCRRVILLGVDVSHSTAYKALGRYWRFGTGSPIEVTILYYPGTQECFAVNQFLEDVKESSITQTDFGWHMPQGNSRSYEHPCLMVSEEQFQTYCNETKKKFQPELDIVQPTANVVVNEPTIPNSSSGTGALAASSVERSASEQRNIQRYNALLDQLYGVGRDSDAQYIRSLSSQGNGQWAAQARVRQSGVSAAASSIAGFSR